MNPTEEVDNGSLSSSESTQDGPIDTELEENPNNVEDGDDIVIVTEGNDGNTIVEESDIQILGVYHDADNGSNVGAMNVDGQDVFVIDVDGDMVFDSMYADINHDGKIDSSEIVDITNDELTVSDLGGFSEPNDSMIATNEEGPDYFSETFDDDMIV